MPVVVYWSIILQIFWALYTPHMNSSHGERFSEPKCILGHTNNHRLFRRFGVNVEDVLCWQQQHQWTTNQILEICKFKKQLY